MCRFPGTRWRSPSPSSDTAANRAQQIDPSYQRLTARTWFTDLLLSRNPWARELPVMVALHRRIKFSSPRHVSNLFLRAAAVSAACSESHGSSVDFSPDASAGAVPRAAQMLARALAI